MPVTVFNPAAAVIVHSQVAVDPLTFQMLEAEAALLVHGCTRRATRQEWKRYDSRGRLIVFVRHSPVLTYNVRATALYPDGENLGNYHPGRCLSDRALDFLNGGRTPFQFEKEVSGVIPGKLIYMDPVQEPGAGDAVEVEFRVEHAFIELDAAEYPGGGVAGGGDWGPDAVVLDVQAPVRFTSAARRGIGKFFFQGTSDFGTDLPALRLYDGTPGSGGTVVAGPVAQEWWQDESEPDQLDTTQSAMHLPAEFPSSTSARQFTHVTLERNGIILAVWATGTVAVAAGKTVVIPEGALSILLTWPRDGNLANPLAFPVQRLAFWMLFNRYGYTDPLPSAPSNIQFYPADPWSLSGTVGGGMELTRDSSGWTLSTAPDAIFSNAAGSSADAAGPGSGGWSVAFAAVVVPTSGWNVILAVREFDPPLSVAEGDHIDLDAADISVELT